jgi:hypothetical protein
MPTVAASLELTGLPDYGEILAKRKAWKLFETTMPKLP